MIEPFSVPHDVKGYELVDVVGRGSFSVVYKALNQKKTAFVAIKVIMKKHITTSGDSDHLEREIHVMDSIHHPNVLALLEHFEDDDYFYLVMEFCDGGSLFDHIRKGVKIREPQAATLFRQIADAVLFCHSQKVAHRDLKPQNILISEFPEIKISDFGLCGHITDEVKMSTFCGSPCYAAPECLSHTPYDGRQADIWSLGVILYEIVTCQHPWNVENTPQMIQQILKGQFTIPFYITTACSELIRGMLKVNPEERMTLDDVLMHPWMKIAAKRPNLPKLNPLNPTQKQPSGLAFSGPFSMGSLTCDASRLPRRISLNSRWLKTMNGK